MKEKCVLYVRVSTVLQEYQRQISELTTFAKLKDFEIAETFEDKLSGFKNDTEREGLNNLLKYVETNNIKRVLIWEISRLSRKKRFLEDILEDFFDKKQINIFFYKENVWSLDEKTLKRSFAANLSISILSAMAENEVETMKDRFISQKTLNESLGKYNGGKIVFGYTIDENNKYVINTNTLSSINDLNISEEDIVKEVFNLYESGLVCSKICRICQSKHYPKIVCSTHTLARLLRNKVYIGEKITKLATRPMPRIITDQQFNSVQILLNSNKTTSDKGNKHVYLLRGILKCRFCNKYYVGKQTDDSYICPQNSGSNKTNNKTSCQGGNISISNLDGIIWTRVKSHLKNRKVEGFDTNTIEKTNKKLIPEIESRIKKYEDLIKKVEDNIKKTNIKLMNDTISVKDFETDVKNYKNEIKKINNDISYFQSQIKSLKKEIEQSEELDKRIERINSITDRKQIKEIIKNVIANIIFYKVDTYKTVLIIKYNKNLVVEQLMFNSVSKKGCICKYFNRKYIYYDPQIKRFYFRKDLKSDDKQLLISTKLLKENGVTEELPEFIDNHMYYSLIRKYKLKINPYDYDKIPNLNSENADILTFDELYNKDNVIIKSNENWDIQVFKTFEYSKMTYFKDLNNARFSRKRNNLF